MIGSIKRFLVVLLVVGATFCLFSCRGENKDAGKDVKVDVQIEERVDSVVEEVFDVSGCDIMYFANGKFNFYRMSDSTSMVYEGEDGEIINYCFKPHTKFLYYCVKEKDNVVLKSIDFDEVNPEPVMVADFGLKVDECESQTFSGYGSLVINKDGSAVGIQHNFSWDSYGFSMVKIFYPETGEIKDSSDWDIFFDGNSNIDYSAFDARDDGLESGGYKFYYVKNGVDICISDKIQFNDSPEDFYTYEYSPDGKNILYGAVLDWGDYPHGPYCIASLDGKYQLALEDTDLPDIAAIEWLDNGSLVYVGIEPRPTSDPDYDAKNNAAMSCVKIVVPGDLEPKVLLHDVDDFLLIKEK